MELTPKFNLLYYKHLVDVSFYNFLDLYSNSFSKNTDGNFYLSELFSKQKIKKIFVELIINELLTIITKYDKISPNYYFIINGCQPKNNLLLTYKNNNYFPVKLAKLIENTNVKYFIKEKDIKVNIELFNEIFSEIFNDFFIGDRNILKDYNKNVFFIQHNKLDCYAIFKILKYLYGNSNCINLYIEKYKDKILPLVSVNDLINKYIHEKHKLNKSKEFKNIIIEIKNFLNEKGLIYD